MCKINVIFILQIFILLQFVQCLRHKLKLEAFEPMRESKPSYANFGTLRVAKGANRNDVTITGSMTFFKNMGNEGLVTVLVHKVIGADTLVPFYKKSGPFCEEIEKDTFLYPSLVKASNVPAKGVCPFPKNNYTIRNYVMDLSGIPDLTPTGKYKCSFYYSINNDIKWGLTTYATLEPNN